MLAIARLVGNDVVQCCAIVFQAARYFRYLRYQTFVFAAAWWQSHAIPSTKFKPICLIHMYYLDQFHDLGSDVVRTSWFHVTKGKLGSGDHDVSEFGALFRPAAEP